MKYEVIEDDGEWLVRSDREQLARFATEAEALDHVAARLREAAPGQDAISLRVRYQARG